MPEQGGHIDKLQRGLAQSIKSTQKAVSTKWRGTLDPTHPGFLLAGPGDGIGRRERYDSLEIPAITFARRKMQDSMRTILMLTCIGN